LDDIQQYRGWGFGCRLERRGRQQSLEDIAHVRSTNQQTNEISLKKRMASLLKNG